MTLTGEILYTEKVFQKQIGPLRHSAIMELEQLDFLPWILMNLILYCQKTAEA
jgi:hypothetical protein